MTIPYEWVTLCRRCDGDRLFLVTMERREDGAPVWTAAVMDFPPGYDTGREEICRCTYTEEELTAWEQDELAEFLNEVQNCRVCGCSEEDPCADGCSWVERDLCSACAPVLGAVQP